MKRKLPIGIQTFRRMREENRYYVDKTAFCWRLVEEGDRYFLSRPRRFGKSLLVDNIEGAVRGQRAAVPGSVRARQVDVVGALLPGGAAELRQRDLPQA